MDFGALPPEINSGLMYSGPGSGSMLAAAAAWDRLATEMQSAASSYATVISGLTSGTWRGPASAAMAAAAAPFVTWMNATGTQAEQAAAQARAAAGAYQVAFAMTVPPPVIAANRTQLMALIATNFFGQNTPAIAATEAEYAAMWAQDATAMYGYAGNAAAASVFTPFTPPPQTTNPAGLAAQTAAAAQSAGTTAGSSQTSISQLMNMLPNALNGMASPAASTSSGSDLLSQLLTALGLAGTSSTATTVSPLGGIDSGSLATTLIAEYADLPGFFGMFMGSNALAPMLYTAESQALTAPAAAASEATEGVAAEGAAGAAAAADIGGTVGPALGGGWGAVADLGQAAALGPLSVPPNWLWSAASPMDMVAPAGVPILLSDAEIGAGSGWPVFMGGLPRAAAVGAAAGAGAAAVKYGARPTVMARPPAAGYPTETRSPANSGHPAPAAIPTNGHAPPGYRPAIVYVPTNGHAPATT